MEYSCMLSSIALLAAASVIAIPNGGCAVA
jgi:hypothetical protein